MRRVDGERRRATQGEGCHAWCILRTAPSRTVPLVAVLSKAGFTAWTPQQMAERRVSRVGAMKKISLPLTPSIAFADYDRLPELVALSRAPTPACRVWDEDARAWTTKRVPPFSVFRYLDAYPRVADRDLDALRIAEQRVRPKGKARTFVAGETVKLIGGGFEGLVGTVQGTRGQYTLVTFGDWNIPVQIAAVNLLPVSAAAA